MRELLSNFFACLSTCIKLSNFCPVRGCGGRSWLIHLVPGHLWTASCLSATSFWKEICFSSVGFLVIPCFCRFSGTALRTAIWWPCPQFSRDRFGLLLWAWDFPIVTDHVVQQQCQFDTLLRQCCSQLVDKLPHPVSSSAFPVTISWQTCFPPVAEPHQMAASGLRLFLPSHDNWVEQMFLQANLQLGQRRMHPWILPEVARGSVGGGWRVEGQIWNCMGRNHALSWLRGAQLWGWDHIFLPASPGGIFGNFWSDHCQNNTPGWHCELQVWTLLWFFCRTGPQQKKKGPGHCCHCVHQTPRMTLHQFWWWRWCAFPESLGSLGHREPQPQVWNQRCSVIGGNQSRPQRDDRSRGEQAIAQVHWFHQLRKTAQQEDKGPN